jgi:type IV secretion system protein VirD4
MDPAVRLIVGWDTDLTSRAALQQAVTKTPHTHSMTIAPTGAGKGVGVVIPNLLNYRGPIIVIDPKAENYFITHEFRRKLGQKVYLVDPFGETEALTRDRDDFATPKIDRFNPLDLLTMKRDPESRPDDAIMITELFSPDDDPRNNLWNTKAKELVSGIVYYLATHPRETDRSLRRLSEIFTTEEFTFTESDLDPFNGNRKTFIDQIIEDPDTEPFAKAQLRPLQQVTRGGMMSDIFSFVTNFLSVMRSERVLASLADATIDFDTIRDGKDFTIYIVIPPNKLVSHRPLLRAYVGVLMAVIMQRKEEPELPTLFLLDECAQLGMLEHLRTAVTLLRGYGLRTWMFFQDLSQLKRLYYGDWETMVANCGVVQAFGLNRAVGNEDLAKTLGFHDSKAVFEMLRISRNHQIASIDGHDPRLLSLSRYYEDACFRDRAGRDPRRRRHRRP